MQIHITKKTFIYTIIIIAIVGAFWFFRFRNKQSNPGNTVQVNIQQKAKIVKVQSVEQSQIIKETKSYPALVAGDQEATITAKSSGTATALNFALGDKVSVGKILAKIDDSGNNLEPGKNNFESLQIQQLELGVKQAKENLELAKKNDQNIHTEATESAKEIAELQLKNAKLALKGGLDNHLITSTISGSITKKFINQGDSISIGQPIATISNLNQIKFQFYADEIDLSQLKVGLPVDIRDNQNQILPAKIAHISPQADTATRRFLIEVRLLKPIDPLLGTIISVEFETIRKAQDKDSIILPLSAINIGQNENSIFIAENNTAKKIIVSLKKIIGETAEISAKELSPETKIIISGNKVLQDGDLINIQ